MSEAQLIGREHSQVQLGNDGLKPSGSSVSASVWWCRRWIALSDIAAADFRKDSSGAPELLVGQAARLGEDGHRITGQ